MTSKDNRDWEKQLSQHIAAGFDEIRNAQAPHDSLKRSLAAAERIPMTSAAWQRGFKNAALCAVVLCSIVALTAWTVARFAEWPMTISMQAIFGLAGAVAMMAFLISWRIGIRRLSTDVLLLDCGPHPGKRLFQLNAGSFLVVGLLGLVRGATHGEWFAIGTAAYMTGFSVYWWIMSTGRLQIYRAGIWAYCGLLRWENIKSVRWQGQRDATLLIQTSNRVPIFGRGALPIAIEQKDAVQELIQMYMSKEGVAK